MYISYMKDKIRKLIDLPMSTAKGLLLLAAQEGLHTKPFVEKVLIEYEKKKNHSKSANFKALNPDK